MVRSATADYRPKIRSYGRRDKVWTMHYRLAEIPADAALVTVVFLPRNG